ncbi:MAG: hypothetical protein GY820_04400, partial [Gammaproteobacteria bacterium]|nr:hypothetical protein [Gammaproteobacteria bacterium]
SQVPFQPDQSRLEDVLQQFSSQMFNIVTGIDQRMAKIEQKQSQSLSPNFRLSYAEGNIPMKNEKKLYSSSNQSLAKGVQGTHSAVSDLVENKQQSSDYYGGKEQTDNCRQSQSIQTKSGVMQGIHSLPVCMHDHMSECRECQMQCEQQLRNSNEQLRMEADKCNRPMVHTAKVHSAKIHDSCSQRLVNPINRKLIECCDKQNARKGGCQNHQSVDYFYSNPLNGDCCAEKQEIRKELTAGSELANDSPIVAIKQLRQQLDEHFAESAKRYAQSNSEMENKMEKIVTDVRELSEVVDHNIMKRDQQSVRFNRRLLEAEKTTDRFKKEVPITTCYKSLDPRNPWGDAYFESGAPKPGSIAELDQAIKRRLREEANSREPSN